MCLKPVIEVSKQRKKLISNMARFNDKVLVAYFDREEATEEVRVSEEFAALDGRDSASWRRDTRERLRRVRRVVNFKPKESLTELQGMRQIHKIQNEI